MKIRTGFMMSFAAIIALNAFNVARASQRVDVQSSVYSQLRESVNDKTTYVDSGIYLTRLSFKIPDSVVSGDFFDLSMNGVAEIPESYKFTDSNGVEVARVESKICTPNTRSLQFKSISDAEFDALKLKDGPAKCDYRVVFTDAVDNATNISISAEYKNTKIGGFPIANKDYTYNAYIKVNDKVKWADTYTILGYQKSPAITKPSIWHHETRIDTGSNSGISHFGIMTNIYLSGKIIEISTDKDSPIIFSESRKNFANGSNFRFTDETKINPDGVLSYTYRDFGWSADYTDVKPNNAIITSISQNRSEFSSGFTVGSKLNLEAISKMNLKEDDKIPVTYKAKIKNSDGSIVWEGDLSANIIIFGSKSIAELVRSQPPKPVEVPAQPKEQTEIKTPNTGFEKADTWTFVAVIFGLSVITLISVKFLKFEKIKF